MSYIRNSLGTNETVHYIAHFHWVNYAVAYGALIFSLVIAVLTYSPEYPAAMLLAPIMGLMIFLAIMIPIWTTEIGVTNQRVIFKRGFIQRETNELQLRSIEQVNLDQNIFGRIMDYGQLHLHGTGNEEIYLPAIGDPLGFRKALQEAIGEAQNTTEPVAPAIVPHPAEAG